LHVASFHIQIGAISGLDLTPKQVCFHELMAAKLKQRPNSHSSYGVPVSHYEAVHEPRVLPRRIVEYLRTISTSIPGSTDLCLVDLCSTPYFLLRDPLLLELISGIAEACSSGLCNEFVLLLPKMPGSQGAFRSKLRHLDEITGNQPPVVHLISNDGSVYAYEPGKGEVHRNIGPDYETLRVAAYGDFQTRIERKSVRRLGHFATLHPRSGNLRCRHYSYFIHDCGTEMLQAFQQWWDMNDCAARAILYDLKCNDLMRDVVVAHADGLDIRAERIIDVFSSETLAGQIRPLGPVVVVLDAIESGETLRYYAEDLHSLGIEIADDVFVAVSKHGGHLPDPDVRIGALITRPREPGALTCPQCSLRLPFTGDGPERLSRMRSYDLHYMIADVGWTEEPKLEVPQTVGRQYQWLPNFTEMLKRYGDWIGYKLYWSLVEHGVPEAWFLIHPAEADSSSVCQRIYDSAEDDLSIVSVPRTRIESAQMANNSWNDILESSAGESWADQLRDLRGTAGVVVDIFNGSGSTCKTLIELIKQTGNQPLAYACVVDFNPDWNMPAIDSIQKLALYEWPVPRVLYKES